MSALSFTLLAYAMDSDEAANSHGRTLGDLIMANKVWIKEGSLILPHNGISSLSCKHMNAKSVQYFAPDVRELRHAGSYLNKAILTDLSVFENLLTLSLED